MAVRFESQAEPIAGYRLIERLGSGGFGEVWKAEAPGGIYKAIKIIHGDLRNRETDTYRFAEQELKSLKRVKQVRHPYLLALDRYDIVEGRLMITMELADCNLWDRFRQCRKQGLPGIPRDELLRYMLETAEVLDLFNDRFQLQHLDIKPQNLFLLYDHIKVADFGQVKDLEGIMATVTGGITPVYAAPETFDGFVSRYCDQYSLACVYQELLTGQRPFDGTSMQQLLMQHLQMPPNLQPSPPCDRGPLARALSKKPDERFPSVMAFVKALQAGDTHSKSGLGVVSVHIAPFQQPSANPTEAQASDQIRVSWTSSAPAAAPISEPSPATPTGLPIPSPSQASGGSMPDITPMPLGVFETSVPLDREATAEQTGPGSIRPALIIGLGYTGQRTLQRLQKQILDRFGSAACTPSVRLLYLDTDPEALQAAQSDQPWEGLAALPSECVFPVKLNRASHYLMNQINARTLLEDWFETQLLYRLPRVPVTTGIRMLGRLAFSDHYRNLHQRLTTELELCTDLANLSDTLNNTGLELATNRPRVYIVAGLGGGTGSGIFLDLAYAVRYRLKRLGYSEPDVVGLLTVPPEGPPDEVTPLAQANTYAALTELHHFSRDGTSYTVNFDERIGGLRDYGAPFTEVYILPGYHSPPPSNPAAGTNSSSPTSSGVVRIQTSRSVNGTGSGPWSSSGRRSNSQIANTARTPRNGGIDLTTDDPTTPLSDFLRLELFTGVGRRLQVNRPPPQSLGAGVIRTFGACKWTWPRAEVIDRVTRIIAPVLLGQWVTPDSHHSRSVVPRWVQEQWVKMKLEPEKLGQMLLQEAKRRLGFDFELVVGELARTLNPRGWLQRLPDPEQVAITLSKWQALIGRPKPPANLEPSQLEEAIAQSLIELMPGFQSDLPTVFSRLVENPLFRLAGAEEAARQMHGQLERSKERQVKRFQELTDQAAVAFDLLLSATTVAKATKKLTAQEFAEAIKTYTTCQVQSLVARAIDQCYAPLRDQLACQLLEIGSCRLRIESAHPTLVAEADIPASMSIPGELLPPGCRNPEDAAQMFVKTLNDHDLLEIDKRVQVGLEQRFGGLYEAGLNSTDGLKGMLQVIREQTRRYLDERLGEVDMAAMLADRYPGRSKVARAIMEAFEKATPRLISGGPWASKAMNVMAIPTGEGGDPIQDWAMETLPVGTILAELRDEIYIHREYSELPLSALAQLGPAWFAAYRSVPDALQVPPHSRLDVTRWTDVDSL